MEYNRPKIKLKLNAIDVWLDKIALAGIILLWLHTILKYNGLPGSIPIHYNLRGEIDGYGSKLIIFLGPLIAAVVSAGMSLLNKYPHIFNYPATITEQNAERQYLLATRLFRFIKLAVAIIFIYINFTIIHDSKTGMSSSRWWDLPIILLAIFMPLTWYFIKAFKK